MHLRSGTVVHRIGVVSGVRSGSPLGRPVSLWTPDAGVQQPAWSAERADKRAVSGASQVSVAMAAINT
jgi:hypothetical protein|eukprot:COSAG06_NODE_1918_length_8067_cov_10.737952_4_plen_68_part_00